MENVPKSWDISDHQFLYLGNKITEVVENQIDSTTVTETENPAVLVEDENVGPLPEQNGTVTNLDEQGSTPVLEESTTKGLYFSIIGYFLFFLLV